MNKLYTLIVLSGLLSSSHSLFAQQGGHYVTIQAGNWHTASGPGIWQGSEPPSNCNDCLIELKAPGQYVLNTSITVSNGTQIQLGDGTNIAQLLIPSSNSNTPTPAAFSQGYNIIMSTSGAESVIQVAANALVSAGSAGTYDGIIVNDPSNTNTKMLGNAPSVFNGNTPTAYSSLPAAYETTINGAAVLSSTGTLPITLTSFDAKLVGTQVELSWATSSESNSDHFAVLRSVDAGSHWETLGTVAAQGTSTTNVDYSYTDFKVPAGTIEYRLQLVDKDGRYVYSGVDVVSGGPITSVSVYPNPAHDYANVTVAGSAAMSATIRLFNQSGQMLVEKNVANAGGTVTALPIGGYPEGTYVIVVSGSDGSKSTLKVLVTK